MRFHTYERRRTVIRSACIIIVFFLGLEVALQGTNDYVSGFSKPAPSWLPDAWAGNRLLVLYLGIFAVFLVDLVVSGLAYFKLASRKYVRRFVSLQLLGIFFLTSAYVAAEFVEERWPFTFVVAFTVTMYIGLTEKYLKPLEPAKQEGLPNQG